MTDLGLARLDGSDELDSAVTSVDTSLPLAADGFTVDVAEYPLLVDVAGELVRAAAATLGGGKVTLTGCDRALNKVTKAHSAGAPVLIANPFRMPLGHAALVSAFNAAIDPPLPGSGVNFRTAAAVLTLAQIEHPSGGTIFAGGAGTTHVVTSEAEWTTAVAAAAPGDIIKITAVITVPLTYRGAKYSIPGGSAANGTAGDPIVIACEGAGLIDVAALTNATAALNIFNVDHIWPIEVSTEGSQFGVFLRNCEGTTLDPIEIGHVNITDSGHAGLSVAGWFQTITASGGTPPAGAGNEWGYSKHVLVDNPTITGPGQAAAATGECFYVGHGGVPGFISFGEDVTLQRGHLANCSSDFVDIKPGSSQVRIHDNEMTAGHFVSGAAIQCLYVTSALDDRPAWYNFDPQISIEGNRIWDGNITNFDASSSNFVIQVSLCGVTVAHNVVWGFASGGIGVRLRSEKPASQSQVGSEVWTIANNTFWLGQGVANAGSNEPAITPFPVGLIDARNNVGETTTTDVEATATSADFIDPVAIPALSSVAADAEWETYGQGSAFDLDPGSSLVAAGVDIADLLTLFELDEDISQRSIPSPSPNHGAFQPA